MKYWERKKEQFPTLYSLSQKYMCYLCSSCSSERLFSDASGYYNERRTRMLPSHLEDQCILHSFIKSDGIGAFENIIFKQTI